MYTWLATHRMSSNGQIGQVPCNHLFIWLPKSSCKLIVFQWQTWDLWFPYRIIPRIFLHHNSSLLGHAAKLSTDWVEYYAWAEVRDSYQGTWPYNCCQSLFVLGLPQYLVSGVIENCLHTVCDHQISWGIFCQYLKRARNIILWAIFL